MTPDELISTNNQNWEKCVAERSPYTRPWLELDIQSLRNFADGSITRLDAPAAYFYPSGILKNISGKKALCLASGGGQQSAVFGLLGADVTVLDLCKGQLKGDQLAADTYGYDIELIQGDMQDLSVFSDDSFDVIYQAISLTFVPNLLRVYQGVHRILKPQGLYRVGHVNPSTVPVCFDGPANGWDGTGYRISEPYCAGPILEHGDGVESMSAGHPTGEFNHLFPEIFNGLIQCGFNIRGVWDDLAGDLTAPPGSEEHMRAFIHQYFCILARKDV